uniref:Uncharacterized protein n=1 Tax=Rhizophora mucronata TaxID=61149 RepID=A0A2P2Q0Y3_RHIMU
MASNLQEYALVPYVAILYAKILSYTLIDCFSLPGLFPNCVQCCKLSSILMD